MLYLYWVTLRKQDGMDLPAGTRLGIGVSAEDEQAAMRIVREVVLHEAEAGAVLDVRRIDSLDELDQGHVRPNMASPYHRGIWFPLGYQ